MFWRLNCLWLVQSGTLIYVRSPEVFESLTKPWKKWVKAVFSFENPPFCSLGLFEAVWGQFWTFLTVFLKSSWSLIGSIRYPYIVQVHNTQNCPNYLERHGQECRLLWEPFLLFWPFPPTFNVSDGFFGIFLVFDWFHEVPWHVRTP